MAPSISVIDHDETVERQLATLAEAIGADLPAYRNHVYRVLTYALHFLDGDQSWRRTLAFALAYHDAGLWTERDLAYLEPSEALAERARVQDAPDLDAALVRDVIHWHHKVTAYRGANARVVNAARMADWVDATGGAVRKGLAKAQIEAVTAAIPIQDFPDVLTRLAADLNHGRKFGGLMRVIATVYKF